MPDSQALPLRDIHLPEPVGWWPPAPGWWLLTLLVIALSVLLPWLWRRWRRVSAGQAARREFAALTAQAELPPEERIRRLSVLMRRACLSLYPREAVASLTGDAWLNWLDRAFDQPRFAVGAGRLLAEAPYRPSLSQADADSLSAICRDWLDRVEKAAARDRRGNRQQTQT